jgi:tungstate transport system substrate-binding protein
MNRIPSILRGALAALLLLAPQAASAQEKIILATTTSTADTGLLDHLLPVFEAKAKVKVKVIAVGTGEALAMGRRGDADVLLVHSRKTEDAFMADGWGALRLDVMHNDFLLVGPFSDPAKAKGQTILEALKRIQASGAAFVSRGDDSGTHKKEQELWKATGASITGKGFISTGQGMGESARVASEKRAYILMDRGTFLALRKTLDLIPVSEGSAELFNPYGVIVVNPARHPRAKAKQGEAFARWLVTPEAQALIGEFGKQQHGQPLFVPDAGK